MARCAHCGAQDAPNEWTLTACADGGRRRVRMLCDPCDAELNAIALRFLRIRGADRKLARYRDQAATS